MIVERILYLFFSLPIFSEGVFRINDTILNYAYNSMNVLTTCDDIFSFSVAFRYIASFLGIKFLCVVLKATLKIFRCD